jgi:hypothetical protein
MCRLALALLIVLVALPVLAGSSAADPEEEAIRAAIEHYFQGHATGQSEHFARVFHPESMLFWVRDGQLQQRTSEDYIAGASGQPPEDEAERRRRIAAIDRTGDAAMVKVELDYPHALFTDYMSMLKVDGRWQIVNKTFTVERRG